jgi:hypothetical protein
MITERVRVAWREYTFAMGMECKSYDDALAFAEVLEIDGACASAEAVRKYARTLGSRAEYLRIISLPALKSASLRGIGTPNTVLRPHVPFLGNDEHCMGKACGEYECLCLCVMCKKAAPTLVECKHGFDHCPECDK